MQGKNKDIELVIMIKMKKYILVSSCRISAKAMLNHPYFSTLDKSTLPQ